MAKFRIYGDTSYDETLSNNNLGEVLAETLGISEDNLRESKQQKHPKMKYNKHDDLANVDTEKKNKKKNKNKKKANKKNEVSFDVIDGISPQQAVTESQQEAPSSQLQSKKTSHPHNNWVPKSVIRQYNSMSIFQQIDKKHKPIKPFDVPRLHSLAQQLKKDHPNMAYENILKNQIELYLDILAERKKYYQSKKSDEDRKKMNDNIEAKYQEIITNPSINPIYDFKIDILQTNTVVKTFDNTILAKKNEEYSYYEVDKYQDNFFDAAEILEKLLQPAEQQKKERREVERAQRKKERQNEKKDTSGKETKRNQKEPENKIDSVTPSDSVVSEVRTTPEAVVEGKSVVVENNNSDAGETKESKQADVVPPITSPKDNHEKMPAEKPESNTPQVPQKKETAETKESNTSNQAKNLCVIDIGTNAVKSNLYINGKYKVPFNREIVRNGKELDEKNVVDSVVEFFGRATNNENEEERIDPKRVFIVATEGFRTSKNAEQMKAEILAKTGRKVHVISPEREAFFSIYGGLKLLDEIEPRYVLFIESGGGSTEASVVDREKRGPSSILSTVSLPLGSRESQIDGDEAKTQTVVAENIKQLLENLKNKGVDVSSSLGMVVNSGIASRIMWKKNHKDGEKYNPVHVTNSHYGMSVADFGQEINTFLQVADTNKEKIEDYGITKEEQLPGFKAHAQILKSIMSEIEKQFSGDIKNCQVLTTHGGLKEGLMQQINRLDRKGKSSEEIENELLVTDKPENLPEVKEENDDFKKGWREFANKVAVVLNGKMEEDTQAKAFVAKITTEKTTTSITATSTHNVSLGAQKSDGSPDIPDQRVFDELAIKSKENGINFGNIQSPEFKARLMIACLKNNVEMSGQPKLDEEFLNSLDANGDSAKYLKAWQNKQNTQQQQNKPTPQPQAQSNYEKTRDEREKMLELHSKTRTLTPQEQHELDYIKFDKAQEKAFEEAIARTGTKVGDPRTAEHTKESGLPPENYTFYPGYREWNGWKLHLDVVPNRNDPTTRAVSEFLEAIDVDHKIWKGGENGKGMTIYVGSYDDACKLSQQINTRFGKNIAEPPLYTDQKSQEIDFKKNVTGRFYLQQIYVVKYPYSSIKGVCPADYGSVVDHNMGSFLSAMAKKENILTDNVSLVYTRDNNFHDDYVLRNLESYCSHKLYQKYLGEFYCGKDADKFEEQIFGGALPPKGSPERTTWDKLADLYIQKSENDYPQGIEKMKELKTGYKPIDFNKVKTITPMQRLQIQH